MCICIFKSCSRSVNVQLLHLENGLPGDTTAYCLRSTNALQTHFVKDNQTKAARNCIVVELYKWRVRSQYRFMAANGVNWGSRLDKCKINEWFNQKHKEVVGEFVWQREDTTMKDMGYLFLLHYKIYMSFSYCIHKAEKMTVGSVWQLRLLVVGVVLLCIGGGNLRGNCTSSTCRVLKEMLEQLDSTTDWTAKQRDEEGDEEFVLSIITSQGCSVLNLTLPPSLTKSHNTRGTVHKSAEVKTTLVSELHGSLIYFLYIIGYNHLRKFWHEVFTVSAISLPLRTIQHDLTAAQMEEMNMSVSDIDSVATMFISTMSGCEGGAEIMNIISQTYVIPCKQDEGEENALLITGNGVTPLVQPYHTRTPVNLGYVVTLDSVAANPGYSGTVFPPDVSGGAYQLGSWAANGFAGLSESRARMHACSVATTFSFTRIHISRMLMFVVFLSYCGTILQVKSLQIAYARNSENLELIGLAVINKIHIALGRDRLVVLIVVSGIFISIQQALSFKVTRLGSFHILEDKDVVKEWVFVMNLAFIVFGQPVLVGVSNALGAVSVFSGIYACERPVLCTISVEILYKDKSIVFSNYQ